MFRWTATAHPGLEPVVARELAALGVEGRPEAGAVTFSLSLEDGADLAHRLHTPDRVLVQVARGPARSLDELAALVRRADWKHHIGRFGEVEVKASGRGSKLRHRETVEKKVARAIEDARRKLRPLRGPRPTTQRVQVPIDAGGEHLHRRGWRRTPVKAPLRENLAASLLVLAGWDPAEPLLDPFCGSGTVLVEAGLMARGRGPFIDRRLACRDWPALARWSPDGRPPRPVRPRLAGSDRSPDALLAAESNASRAGVDATWRRLDVSEVEPDGAAGLVVTNPPYGKRLGESVGGVYAALGRALRGPLEGWRALFLAPTPELARKVDRRAERLTGFSNGGVSVGVWALDG
jgi:putative N6-adenine-specific DNA methylase